MHEIPKNKIIIPTIKHLQRKRVSENGRLGKGKFKDLPKMISKSEFLQNHISFCKAKLARKYDSKKSTGAFHSVYYSKLKCAKHCWKQYKKRYKLNAD